MIDIGTRIKDLRNARRMTQAEFAERINVTKSTVSAYENGTRFPSYDVLIRIARLFKVSTDNLLGYSEKSVVDVTGLTRKQINVIQDVVITYKRHNLLYRQMMDEDSVADRLAAMGLIDEDEADWMK
ncbi:helix-turn-helix transcriptional regulator [Pseudoflavonifractor sp. DSM 107456]|uniref:Helix-turn-helix transcriptional regulator n=1 Tax=Pseudoflavonifractor gallinarum TaxID=2779352 RepID=A0ABR9RB96_9FIRM|nr:helix-turn-helix transcriptional regulator [Pseudoflavonifractor gallinarum]MBE5055956.1 helix-turn-helix transcriptional regulator [Pseudoflavonifractor gallinarum]